VVLVTGRILGGGPEGDARAHDGAIVRAALPHWPEDVALSDVLASLTPWSRPAEEGD
jgi:hypothetical protein